MQITKSSDSEDLNNDGLNSSQPKIISLSNNNIKKDELVRLMMQSLRDLGYSDTADALQYESGVSLESETIIRFRTSILQGNWQTVETLLSQIPFRHNHLLPQIQFLIRKQKFLELLENKEPFQALHVLRTEITPLIHGTDKLHQLTSLVVFSSIDDVMAAAQWDGKAGYSRERLLADVQSYIDPSAMVPKQRLLTLINQSMEWQKQSCLYHNSSQSAGFSLFSDHICDKAMFPRQAIKVLRGHTDEVWHVAYSHCGKYLASVSKDKTCIIWDMHTFEQAQSFKAEESGSYCAWSPDDSKLLVCADNNTLQLWDPYNATLLHTYSQHNDQVTSCVWLSDSKHFISGSCDKFLFLWSCDSTTPVTRWPVQRITDMRISANGQRFVTTGLDKSLTIYDINGFEISEVGKIEETGAITSLTLTKDGRYALLNLKDPQEIHLWDLIEQTIVHKYSGQKQMTYIIRSTLGGENESFVLSGSEDHRVYIWNREHEVLLEELEGHENTVNCVSWCPIEPMQFASASDDHTIRVWGASENAITSNNCENCGSGMDGECA